MWCVCLFYLFSWGVMLDIVWMDILYCMDIFVESGIMS